MKKAIIAIIAIIIIVFALAYVIINIHKYNNGYCSNCGARYVEEKIFSDGNSFTHFECDECENSGYIVDWLK